MKMDKIFLVKPKTSYDEEFLKNAHGLLKVKVLSKDEIELLKMGIEYILKACQMAPKTDNSVLLELLRKLEGI
jgi:hypothetical protein